MRVLMVLDTSDRFAAALLDCIASGLGAGAQGDTQFNLGYPDDAACCALLKADLLITGSASPNGRPSLAMRHWLQDQPARVMRGIGAAAFVTRARKPLLLAGSAADWMSRAMQAQGARLLLPAQVFLSLPGGAFSTDELERASTWGLNLRLQWQLYCAGAYRSLSSHALGI